MQKLPIRALRNRHRYRLQRRKRPRNRIRYRPLNRQRHSIRRATPTTPATRATPRRKPDQTRLRKLPKQRMRRNILQPTAAVAPVPALAKRNRKPRTTPIRVRRQQPPDLRQLRRPDPPTLNNPIHDRKRNTIRLLSPDPESRPPDTPAKRPQSDAVKPRNQPRSKYTHTAQRGANSRLRWISKGKAGVPVELGVPVAIVEDQYQFILEHRILWEGSDTDAALPGTSRLRLRPRLSQPAKCGRPGRPAGTQRHARQGPPVRQPPRTRGVAGLRTGKPAASRSRVGDQQSRAARPAPGAHPRQGWLRSHGCLVHPGCKCAPGRSADPRTGTRTAQVPATKSRLTAPGNRASAARTGLPAALHACYFRKSPIWAPKSPPVRRSPLNAAD